MPLKMLDMVTDFQFKTIDNGLLMRQVTKLTLTMKLATNFMWINAPIIGHIVILTLLPSWVRSVGHKN